MFQEWEFFVYEGTTQGEDGYKINYERYRKLLYEASQKAKDKTMSLECFEILLNKANDFKRKLDINWIQGLSDNYYNMIYSPFSKLTVTEWKACGILELREHYKIYLQYEEQSQKAKKK